MQATLNRIPTVNRTKQLLKYSTPVSNQGYEAAFNSLNVEISHIPRYSISHNQQQEYIYSTCKRFLDVFVALLGLIILAPVFLIIAILIKLDSEGPILFQQQALFAFCVLYHGAELVHGKVLAPFTTSFLFK